MLNTGVTTNMEDCTGRKHADCCTNGNSRACHSYNGQNEDFPICGNDKHYRENKNTLEKLFWAHQCDIREHMVWVWRWICKERSKYKARVANLQCDLPFRPKKVLKTQLQSTMGKEIVNLILNQCPNEKQASHQRSHSMSSLYWKASGGNHTVLRLAWHILWRMIMHTCASVCMYTFKFLKVFFLNSFLVWCEFSLLKMFIFF